jgi:hypothetical protein
MPRPIPLLLRERARGCQIENLFLLRLTTCRAAAGTFG